MFSAGARKRNLMGITYTHDSLNAAASDVMSSVGTALALGVVFFLLWILWSIKKHRK